MLSKLQKGIVLIGVLVIGLMFGAQTTHAQGFVPVFDDANLAVNSSSAASNAISAEALVNLQLKEQALDGIAVGIAKQIISHFTQSIVNWINSGFKDGPAFVTDPEGFFFDVADQVSGQFIERLGIGDVLCGSFQIPIRLALGLHFNTGGIGGSFPERYTCTASAVVDNVVSGDIVDLDAFFNVAVTADSNPYGAYIAAERDLQFQIFNKSYKANKVLDWGNGFLSKEECDDDGKNCKIVTPGSVVEDQLSNVFGSGLRQLELADEINEIVGALTNQLITQVMQAGVSGLSRAEDGINSFIERYPELISQDVRASANNIQGDQNICYDLVKVDPSDPNSPLTCVTERPIETDFEDRYTQGVDNVANTVPVIRFNPKVISKDAPTRFIPDNATVRVIADEDGRGYGMDAGFAVDGRTDGEATYRRPAAIIANSSGSQTGIRIDLGDLVLIKKVNVYPVTSITALGNTQDVSLRDALGSGFYVDVLGLGLNTVGTSGRILPGASERPIVVDVDNVLGRFVDVYHSGGGTFAVSEIEVEGINLSTVPVANLARGGAAASSGVYDSRYGASNAINGVTNGGGETNWRFFSNSQTNPWWEVNLPGQESLIEEIRIHHGHNLISFFELSRFEAYLGNQKVFSIDFLPNSSNPTILHLVEGRSQVVQTMNQTGSLGAYGIKADRIKITRIEGEVNSRKYSGSGYIELGEVEVMGRLIEQ